ncbi:unnamed protein product [Alopecurus aequalis]
MTAMSPARAFLYLVVERSRYPLQSLYTVHRIPPWSLFFSNKDGQRRPRSEAAAEIKKVGMPSPIVTLYPSAGDLPMNFVLFGRGKDKDHGRGLPRPRLPLRRRPRRRLRAAKHEGSSKLRPSCLHRRRRRRLLHQQPTRRICPRVGRPDLLVTQVRDILALRPAAALREAAKGQGRPDQRRLRPSLHAGRRVTALGLRGESHGTYSLDTQRKICYSIEGHEVSRGEWIKLGDWALPFHGRACYAREHNLWFGFSERDQSVLCAADLQQQQPPVLSHQWEGFTGPNKANFRAPVRSFLAHLGAGGRFCIAQFSNDESGRDTAMLTGVEVARCVDGEALCLVKHKTCRYEGLGDDDNPICVL